MSAVIMQGNSSVPLSKFMHRLYWVLEASASRSQVWISGTTLTTVLIVRIFFFFSAVIESVVIQHYRDFMINSQSVSRCWEECL